MQPHDIIAAIAKRTADIGAAFYFEPATLARGKELGIDGFRFYFLGRGGVLGDVEADVARSAFGYFEPALITRLWDTARERATVGPRDVARAYIECNHALGRAKLGGVEGLDAYADAAGDVIAAVDSSGLSLFAGVRAEPLPDDAPARALHQAMVLRELRGSVHLAAVAALGIPGAVAHAIKRPDDLAQFGYEGPPTITDADRAALDHAEQLTDAALVRPFSVLDDAGVQALIAGTDAIHAALFG